MYDPVTDTWTQLPDLPIPMSGAKMELLNGKTTIIGGNTQDTPGGPVNPTNILLSYDPKNNQWNVDGNIKLPRSNHLVMQIPKQLIPGCFYHGG